MITQTATQKEVLGVYRPGSAHMVGDGFPVRNLFPSNDLDERLSPFLMLDYAGPRDFSPTEHPRGVGEHPHRGFETVTIMYQGRVAHRDSAGNGGVIGPDDVQWMTAASGVVHEEMHEREWAKQGGAFQAIQLWVNLPAQFKMSAPRYQTLVKQDIPTLPLADGGGDVRVIAGEFGGRKGPAQTVTPVELLDVRLRAGGHADLTLPAGHHTGVFVLSGEVKVNGATVVGEAELVVLGSKGERVQLEAMGTDALVLVMAGEPIKEPIARYGPFVMNTRQELVQAVDDYRAGKMGHLS
ncbi:MAG: pirin family protein [Nitrospiraceae bacterium]|nr:pirin family protein [Nitrospiraceae bacterium]